MELESDKEQWLNHYLSQPFCEADILFRSFDEGSMLAENFVTWLQVNQ